MGERREHAVSGPAVCAEGHPGPGAAQGYLQTDWRPAARAGQGAECGSDTESRALVVPGSRPGGVPAQARPDG